MAPAFADLVRKYIESKVTPEPVPEGAHIHDHVLIDFSVEWEDGLSSIDVGNSIACSWAVTAVDADAAREPGSHNYWKLVCVAILEDNGKRYITATVRRTIVLEQES